MIDFYFSLLLIGNFLELEIYRGKDCRIDGIMIVSLRPNREILHNISNNIR